jgi:FMN hydrolase / 5-amino-6-(5-phospho-D-ribitylamino)uracil phosphatase
MSHELQARAMPEVILWDVMDTLVRDPFFTHMAGFFGLTFDELLRRKHPATWVEFEVGKLDEQGLYDAFFTDGTPIDGPGFKRHVRDAYAWIEGIETLLHDLKQNGVEMHALSNYPPWYQLIEERLQLSRYVELTFFSCDTGVRKPAPEAYLEACQKLGRRPDECLFIDDRAQNTEAAKAVGLHALQFDGDVTALRASLRDLGFLRA